MLVVFSFISLYTKAFPEVNSQRALLVPSGLRAERVTLKEHFTVTFTILMTFVYGSGCGGDSTASWSWLLPLRGSQSPSQALVLVAGTFTV